MMIIKGDRNSEAGVMPEPERLAATGEYNTALIDAGALLACEGLHPTSQGFKLRKVGGKITVIDGPFSEAKEVIAGYWIIQANSLQEAIEWAMRVPFEAGGPAATGEVEVRQIADMPGCAGPADEPAWHAPRPAPAAPAEPRSGERTYRYIILGKADADTEAGRPPDPALVRAMGDEMGKMMAAGVLLGGEGLAPSSRGAKVQYHRGQRRVIDGPFAETKELIAGFAIVRVRSREEALEWARRGVEINGDCESECRRIFEEEDFPAEVHARIPEVFEAERAFRARATQ